MKQIACRNVGPSRSIASPAARSVLANGRDREQRELTDRSPHRKGAEIMEQELKTEQATGLRIVASNNYSCSSEQNMITETTEGPLTLVDVAIALDQSRHEAMERRGRSGIGAGARLEATFGADSPEDDDSDGEEITSIDDVVVRDLPVGAVGKLRHALSQARREQAWNGNNFIASPTQDMEDLMARIRARD